MNDEGLERAPRRRPALGWPAAVLALAIVAGATSGAVVSLMLDDSDGPAGGATGDADAVVRAVAEALPAVVTVINELPAAQGGGVAGGAGFIADARGFVVTNEHLVSVQGKLSVVLNDGEIRPAELVSHDAPFTDLAVLRIPAGGLTALDLGDSEALALGETLIALGSPDIDYRNSVTVGVVSGLGRRKLLGGIYREDLIQTDAAINVGSSGGPLVNLRGEVVGVVSFRDIGAEDPLFGISFAISSRTMRPIVESIIDRGEYPRPYFGVEHEDIDADAAQALGLGVDRGALVGRVFGGSPAEKAGIRVGDVILRLGQTELDAATPFLNALARVSPGARVSVQLLRDGRALEVTVEVTPR